MRRKHSTTLRVGMVTVLLLFVKVMATIAGPASQELTSFDVENVGNSIRIRWQTGMSYTISHFIIHYSVDGKEFIALDTLEAEYSTDATTYTYYGTPTAELNYFYVSTVDIDGNVYNSEIKVCEAETEELRVFPNPVRDRAHLLINALEEQQVSYQLYTLQGNLIGSRQDILEKGLNQRSFEVSELATGQYLLKTQLNGKQISLRVFKE